MSIKNNTTGMVGRALRAPDRSFFLFGPRGTGKSTWVRSRFPDAIYIDLLDDALRREYLAYPERLAERVAATPRARTIVIDEIQKAPDLLNTVHRLIEAKKGRRFVMTGSSARKLRREGVNLLGGRALVRKMHPFMAAELGDVFRIEEALKWGLLPVIHNSPHPLDQLKAYVSLYVREEVEAEGFVRRIDTFARFLEAMTFSHASILNLNNVARDAQATRRVVENYVEILEDLHFGWRLTLFSRRAKRAITSHPKFYFSDTGIFRALRPSGPLDRPEELAGAALEGLVAQHLRAWIDYRGRSNRLHFWRTKGGSEVDFVVYGDDGLHAIEVKNSSRVRPEDLRGLKAFLEDFPSAVLTLLYRGKDRLKIGRILCVPAQSYLTRLNPLRSLVAARGD